jgi:hypothetical protein
MLIREVRATVAPSPYNTFDSLLETPTGNSPDQNVWLTLQLRVALKFADSKNPDPNRMVSMGGKWYVKDASGYLFPALDWPPHLILRFMREYRNRAEKTWNWQFVLITPKDCSDLDYETSEWKVRPNVICLFRLAVSGPSGLLDSSPAAGPLRVGTPHQTITVYNLDYAVKSVNLAAGVTPTTSTPATRNIASMDGLQWRSDSLHYDDADVFRPGWWDPAHNVVSNTVGHEVGHSLGQCHIMGLKGNPLYNFTGAQANSEAAYGKGSGDPFDAWNIMGSGDRVYLINAVSWSERIRLHFNPQIPSAKWQATGIMQTPPRKIPIALSGGLEPAQW